MILDEIIESAKGIDGINLDALRIMLLESGERTSFIDAVTEGEKMVGFMFATIEYFDGQDVCFIQACRSDKAGVCQKMLDKCIEWAKTVGVKKMVFMSRRSPLAWKKKYKFNQSYVVMERAI